ncbi:MAG: 50S ribosomal protein L18 [Gammaproteobacteria bacterium]|nr:50S ribosomal protein L18 [Gammaproteobacteria bacterium]MCY4200298.1 50S ribosomal protein L18 [Gammaproteobacteria bacterium]MCY4278547.1 50S ribosomal protein L18 [Gammaproteobacteria bacterium]MCY4323178.1 50S ribosomal protein L18 [Gammaproteobacteria bacterium]
MSVANKTLKYKPADTKARRLRRARRARFVMREQGVTRLTVHRTPRHIYAQLIGGDGGQVLAAASSLEKDLGVAFGGNIEAAKRVGQKIAERAQDKSVSRIAFDRSGFRYHGRVKALADAAREAGLEF